MFRFTIRDVLWLTVVVGMGLGWWNEHRRFTAYHELVTRNIKWAPVVGGFTSVSELQSSNQATDDSH